MRRASQLFVYHVNEGKAIERPSIRCRRKRSQTMLVMRSIQTYGGLLQWKQLIRRNILQASQMDAADF